MGKIRTLLHNLFTVTQNKEEKKKNTDKLKTERKKKQNRKILSSH